MSLEFVDEKYRELTTMLILPSWITTKTCSTSLDTSNSILRNLLLTAIRTPPRSWKFMLLNIFFQITRKKLLLIAIITSMLFSVKLPISISSELRWWLFRSCLIIAAVFLLIHYLCGCRRDFARLFGWSSMSSRLYVTGVLSVIALDVATAGKAMSGNFLCRSFHVGKTRCDPIRRDVIRSGTKQCLLRYLASVFVKRDPVPGISKDIFQADSIWSSSIPNRSSLTSKNLLQRRNETTRCESKMYRIVNILLLFYANTTWLIISNTSALVKLAFRACERHTRQCKRPSEAFW